ncbi:MAG TPA: hypothetical protein VF517_03925, partial [Thermoleophilaceae bacterium]
AVAMTVTVSWAPPDAEALAALVYKQRRTGFGAGPVGAFIQPARERGAQLRVDRDVADVLVFAEDPQEGFAGGAGDVVDVEGDDLGDPRAGVERDERERLVARRRAALDFAEERSWARWSSAAAPWRRSRRGRRSRARGRGGCRSRRRRRARC